MFLSLKQLHIQTGYRLIDTNIHRHLRQCDQVLLFRKLIATNLIYTEIHTVVVIDGKLILPSLGCHRDD